MNYDLSALARNFSACIENELIFPETWLKSASIFIPQLVELIGDKHVVIPKPIEDFINVESETLKQILDRNCSNKALSNYHHLYSYILNCLGKHNTLNILQIGIEQNIDTSYIGASLRAFQEYLPFSRIFGADINNNILLSDERIRTSFVDQLNFETFFTLQNTFADPTYDLIIDQGLHSIGANLNTLIFALKKINKNGWIIIEDIGPSFLENWVIVDFVLSQNKEIKTFIIAAKQTFVYAVWKLPI
jgi:hypothetical protein